MSVPRESVIIPEVFEPDEKLPRDLVALRKFAVFMDEAVAIPGTRQRVGFNGLITLVPGIGPVIGAILSTWIVFGALRHRVPLRYVVRMVINILLDLFIGEIPILGDIFDIAFEENMRNVKLLLRNRDRSRPPRSMGAIAVSAALVVCIIFFAAFVAVAALVVTVIWIANKR